jgi:hypothetical protein
MTWFTQFWRAARVSSNETIRLVQGGPGPQALNPHSLSPGGGLSGLLTFGFSSGKTGSLSPKTILSPSG